MSAVVDSSVATVLFTGDHRYSAARNVFASERELSAPTLILVETANALWTILRRNADPAAFDTAQTYVAHELPDRILLYPDESLVEAALTIARALDHPVYDCLFLALAVLRRERLYTFDARLIAKIAGTAWETYATLPTA